MKKIFTIYFLLASLCTVLFAAQIPMGQDAGSRMREYTEEQKKEKMMKEITTPRSKTPALNEPEIEALPNDAKSVYIARIIIQKGSGIGRIADEKGLAVFIGNCQDKNFSLEDMKALAVSVTKKFTPEKTTAYIPAQSFDEGIMYINIVSETGGAK